MKTFAIAALAAVSQATIMDDIDYKFMKWISEHGKFYETVEQFVMRRDIFKRTNDFIEKQNAKVDSLFKSGHNFLSDWTQQEYISMMGLRNQEMDKPEGKMLFTGTASNDSLDWRDVKDVVTPVKDQG